MQLTFKQHFINDNFCTVRLLTQAYRNVQYVPPAAVTANVCRLEVNDIGKTNGSLGGSKRVKNSLLGPHSNCTMIPEESHINVSPGEQSDSQWGDRFQGGSLAMKFNLYSSH